MTFNTPESFINGVNNFIKKIGNGEIECIDSVIRIKNGFRNVLSWKSMMDCQYCDMKLNIVIIDKNNESSVIGEIQFLLNWYVVVLFVF